MPLLYNSKVNTSHPEAHSEAYQTSQVEVFAKMVNGFQPLLIFSKSYALAFRQSSKYTSGNHLD